MQKPGTCRTAVVVNPSKVEDLDGRRREICAALAEADWPEPMWLETTPQDPGCGQTQQAVEAGVDVVFAFGGDGTVMACAGSLAGTDVALAVLPSGTGNLLAANLGLPDDVAAGVKVVLDRGRRQLDVGVVEDKVFVVMAGMGFDAKMVDDAPEKLKKRLGWPAYVVSALKHLRDRPMRLTIKLDGHRTLRRLARMVVVGNVGRLQGGMVLLTAAEPDDGLLDVAVVSPRSLAHWLTLGWSLMTKHPSPPRMETFRAREVRIRSDRPQARELDGDVIASGRELNVGVRHKALWLCVPQPDESEDLAEGAPKH